jgi:hypothetical protein
VGPESHGELVGPALSTFSYVTTDGARTASASVSVTVQSTAQATNLTGAGLAGNNLERKDQAELLGNVPLLHSVGRRGTTLGQRAAIGRQLDQSQRSGNYVGSITLTAGQKYDIRMEYFEKGGKATATLSWSSPSQPKETIPVDVLYLEAP